MSQFTNRAHGSSMLTFVIYPNEKKRKKKKEIQKKDYTPNPFPPPPPPPLPEHSKPFMTPKTDLQVMQKCPCML